MVASQGGPREHLARFRAIGTKWLHVVASVEHAKKAEAAGVDALVVDGAEAGGHPPPSEVGTLVLVRRVVKAVEAAGRGERRRRRRRRHRRAARARRRCGAARHALHRHARGERARELQARGARGGSATRPRSSAAAALPIRQLKNAFSREVRGRRAPGAPRRLRAIVQARQLKQAALEGDVEWGKVEAGQSAGPGGRHPAGRRDHAAAGARKLEAGDGGGSASGL